MHMARVSFLLRFDLGSAYFPETVAAAIDLAQAPPDLPLDVCRQTDEPDSRIYGELRFSASTHPGSSSGARSVRPCARLGLNADRAGVGGPPTANAALALGIVESIFEEEERRRQSVEDSEPGGAGSCRPAAGPVRGWCRRAPPARAL